MSRIRWKYAVMLRFDGGQRFLMDYDTETRPRVGLLLAVRNGGVFKIFEREDPRGKGDGIGTLHVRAF